MTSLRRKLTSKGFDLRLWLMAVSVAAIVAVSTTKALLLSHYVAQSFIDREGEVAREFLDSIVSAEHSGGRLFDEPAPSPELVSFSGHVRNLPGMLRAVIYAPDYSVRFSTDAQMIGSRFPDNEELKEAFEGRVIANIEELEEGAKAEHVNFNLPEGTQVIEAYIPVRGDSGKVVAVVEFYSRPDALQAIISRVTAIIWISALLAGLLLFAALYSAVTRGSRIIERQKRDLADMTALAALGQMAGAVAHSLRNPLAGIRSSVELLKLEQGEAVEPATTDILGEVDRMNRHVHELLDYSHSESDASQRVVLNTVLRDQLQRLEPRFTRHRIAVEVDDRGAEDATVKMDAPMFGQALASILSNAIEAMPDGGSITARLRRVAGKRQVELQISDTGRGIPPELLKQLPSPFLTTKTRGLGLGLTLTERIMHSFGGSLSLASTPGDGTTATLRFPEA